MLASFIVPCYNVSKTIERCLDSIYSLKLMESEFEVIVVDDGSVDDTLEKLRDYSLSHQNFRIIRHLVNRSLGAARNSGIAEAKGKYIVFVDSDDEVGPGVVLAFHLADERSLDMVAMMVQVVDDEGRPIKEMTLPIPDNLVLSGIDLLVNHPTKSHGACFYVFSCSLMARIHGSFIEGVYYEDVDFVCQHLYVAERVAYCPLWGYRYYMNHGSITHSLSIKRLYGSAYLGSRLLEFAETLPDRGTLYNVLVQRGQYFLCFAFLKMILLNSLTEMRSLYYLIDTKMSRHEYLKRYKWNKWTSLCLRWKEGAILLAGVKKMKAY